MTTDYPIIHAILNTLLNIISAVTAISFIIAPFVLIYWFITSIVKFVHAEKGTKPRNIWRGNLIASSIVLGVTILFAIFIAIIIHIAQDAVIYM